MPTKTNAKPNQNHHVTIADLRKIKELAKCSEAELERILGTIRRFVSILINVQPQIKAK
ncbi:MAG: hypothetical protein AAF570_11475 [Bacteroidota bacterium]